MRTRRTRRTCRTSRTDNADRDPCSKCDECVRWAHRRVRNRAHGVELRHSYGNTRRRPYGPSGPRYDQREVPPPRAPTRGSPRFGVRQDPGVRETGQGSIDRGDAARQLGLVRGVVAERVAVSVPLDPFLSLKALAGYSSLSVRKLRDHLDDPSNPLPCYQVGGKILVRRSEFDTWISSQRRVRHGAAPDVARIVSDIVRSL